MLKRFNRAMDHEYFSYIMVNENILELFKVLSAIPASKSCASCKKPMIISKSERHNIGFLWRCTKCKKDRNILSDCSLDGTKISPFVFLKFAFYFFNKNNFTANYVMQNTGIGEEMYKVLLGLFRKKISEFIESNKRQLGGVLKEVQIDETFWAKRKYGVGDVGKSFWVFGAIEFKTGYCYIQKVENRKSTTLLPIINNEIKKKSYVVSDKWAVYKRITDRFTDSVCHKHYFVDPETRANTQKIENLWMHLKKIKHYSFGISLDTIPEHLNVFMFFRNFKDIEFAEFLEIVLIK
ncbi:hypothetical protein DMUE_5364 [Dictyocoela muelleri]|nr:hypothetical protein DMUE_5364 [Dictyocoela muelleri]